MKVLLCHNYYLQAGGEDVVFADEAAMLEGHGHQVLRYTLHNKIIEHMPRWRLARRTVWNPQSYRELRELIRRERPQIMHCTNTFPLISPAAYYAARAEDVPVVQSLHNYRLLGAVGNRLAHGEVSGPGPIRAGSWQFFWSGGYRGSRPATAVLLAMLTWHGLIRTWTRAVDRYIALSEFSRRQFVEHGFPADKVVVKPNCVGCNGGPGAGAGGYAVFVGRLTPEKGIRTLLEAWPLLDRPTPLKIIGDGPLAEQVKAAARADPNIQWMGRVSLEDAMAVVGDAACLVFPSVWFETFGRTIIEAFAAGTPVVAAKRGPSIELVDEGRTGLFFEPGNAADLAAKVRLLTADPGKLANMRRAARSEFERKYTAEINYGRLMQIYNQVLRAPREQLQTQGAGQ
ncbi:MAG: glycosyltransferase family 4 protein [Thermoguttaceae bacterium]|jgi:glycosyltransferase involved in cell wall biosynthesis